MTVYVIVFWSKSKKYYEGFMKESFPFTNNNNNYVNMYLETEVFLSCINIRK